VGRRNIGKDKYWTLSLFIRLLIDICSCVDFGCSYLYRLKVMLRMLAGRQTVSNDYKIMST